MKPYIAWAVFGALALDAAAQQSSGPDPAQLASPDPAHITAPDPADPTARVPQASYRSAFEDYKAYREQEIASWREVNDEVARVGGHVGIFRGAAQGAHGHAMPTKPASGAPAGGATEAGAQAPARGAPKAPAGEAPLGKPSAGGHHGH